MYRWLFKRKTKPQPEFKGALGSCSVRTPGCCVFFFNFFNWRITTLQYCDGFAIHQYESAMGTHVSTPILNPPPTSRPTAWLQMATEHGFWVPCVMHQTPTGYLFYRW